MNCPHCSRSLKGWQRRRRRCLYCREKFVFEPRVNELHLHDLKVRRLAGKLSDGGRLHYTVTQLWYAATRTRATRVKTLTSAAGCLSFYAALAGLAAVVGFFSDEPGWVIGYLVVAGLAVVLINVRAAMTRSRERRGGPPPRMIMPLGEFRNEILRKWPEIYHALPNGMIDELRATAPAVARPRIALVCPDRAVLACLAANGVPEAFDMAFTMTLGNVPPHIPVVVVHDASADGCRFAASVRASLPGRAVAVAGLHPRMVLRRPRMLRLRDSSRPRGLAGLGLTKEEHDWLAQGWWSPVAAIGPAQLIAAVSTAAGRALSATDPDHRQAERLGFLTWPAS
jgi:hypothetical protein